MLSLAAGHRYYLRREVTDLRKGFDSLSGLVRDEMDRNPLGGDVFIFFNRRRNQVKLLHWEGDGFAIWFKRLEQGSFEWPEPAASATGMEISSESLLLILHGFSLGSVKKRKRYTMLKNVG